MSKERRKIGKGHSKSLYNVVNMLFYIFPRNKMLFKAIHCYEEIALSNSAPIENDSYIATRWLHIVCIWLSW